MARSTARETMFVVREGNCDGLPFKRVATAIYVHSGRDRVFGFALTPARASSDRDWRAARKELHRPDQGFPESTSIGRIQWGNPSDHPTERTSVFKGCLQVSTGIFTLTDDSGMTYQIQGDTSKLREHLGHEVQITGTASTSEASQGSGASTNSSQQPTIHLRAVKHLSKTCESAKN